MLFKRRLKQARMSANLSQGKVAEILGVTRQAVSNWENERSTSTPDPDTIARLAELYGVTPNWLLGVSVTPRSDQSNDDDDTPIENRIVRAAAASGDLSGWSEEQLRLLEMHIRIAKQAIMAEEEAKRERKDS